MTTTNTGQSMATINIRGKEYVQVKERVRYVNEEGGGYDMLEHDVITIGNRSFLRVKIAYNDHTYYGTAEIKLDNAERGSADEKSPMECAETSAVGRAFAFAGVGVIDSIASADEMHKAGVSNNYAPRQGTDTVTSGNQGSKPVSEGQMAALKRNNIPDEYLNGLDFEGAKRMMNAAKENGWKYPWQEVNAKPAPKTQAKAPTSDERPDDDLPF